MDTDEISPLFRRNPDGDRGSAAAAYRFGHGRPGV
jgi:hypothetical protein